MRTLVMILAALFFLPAVVAQEAEAQSRATLTFYASVDGELQAVQPEGGLADADVVVVETAEGSVRYDVSTAGDTISETTIDVDGETTALLAAVVELTTDAEVTADADADTGETTVTAPGGITIHVTHAGDTTAGVTVMVPSDAEGDANLDADVDADADAGPGIDGDADADVDADTDVDVEGEGEGDVNVDVEGDGEQDDGAASDAGADASADAEADAGARVDVNVDTDVDGDADVDVETEGGADVQIGVPGQ